MPGEAKNSRRDISEVNKKYTDAQKIINMQLN